MPPTATETLTTLQEPVKLSIQAKVPAQPNVNAALAEAEQTEEYKYAHLLPVFDPSKKYPPLEPFDHVDPGHRALSHENPRSFLTDRQANVIEITPAIGNEIRGVNLLDLNNDERDQLALEVARRGVLVFRDQEQVSYATNYASNIGHLNRSH